MRFANLEKTDAASTRCVGAAFAFVLAACLALAGCDAPSVFDETETASVDWPTPDPAIFEITSADGEVEGWILGTIHALPDDIDWRTDAIERVVTEADYLVLEVDNFDDSASVFTRLSTTAGLGDLTPRLPADLVDEYEAMVRRSHYNQASFRDMEEWAAAIILSQVDAPGRAANGVDRAMLAAFDGREIRGFETAAQQFGAFDMLAVEDQRVLLTETIVDWAGGPDTRKELMRAWIAGDSDRLEEATTEGIMADPELREALLVGRNKAWLEQLLPMLEGQERPLVAVGAAHVLGPEGLPAMLEARGYEVRPVSE